MNLSIFYIIYNFPVQFYNFIISEETLHINSGKFQEKLKMQIRPSVGIFFKVCECDHSY